MNGIFKDTLAELKDKKTIYLFLVITVITILLLLSSGSMSMQINGEEQLGLEELGIDVGLQLLNGVQGLMSLLIFLSVLMTAGLIPNMFIKGRADYYLSKPLSRTSLLLKKFLSIWIVFGGLIAICGLSSYLVGSAVHSVFNNAIFMLIGFAFIEFFIWLTISFFVGITTGKTVTAITSIFLIWLAQIVLSKLHVSQIIFEKLGYELLGKFLDYLYYILPKTSELSDLFEEALKNMASLNSYVFYSSVGFGFVMLFLSLFLFKRKNY